MAMTMTEPAAKPEDAVPSTKRRGSSRFRSRLAQRGRLEKLSGEVHSDTAADPGIASAD